MAQINAIFFFGNIISAFLFIVVIYTIMHIIILPENVQKVIIRKRLLI